MDNPATPDVDLDPDDADEAELDDEAGEIGNPADLPAGGTGEQDDDDGETGAVIDEDEPVGNALPGDPFDEVM